LEHVSDVVRRDGKGMGRRGGGKDLAVFRNWLGADGLAGCVRVAGEGSETWRIMSWV
jgi:hypothetical protein